MSRALPAALLLLGGVLAARLDAVSTPALERAPGNAVVLTSLPPVLRQQEVRHHLGTGLTTTLAFEVRVLGADKTRGGARIDVRYELWDEVWLVTRADTSGRIQRARFPSFEQLEAWWSGLRLEVLPAQTGAGQAEIRLRIIPFSQSEQLDAQRWFSRRLAEEPAGSAGAVSGVLAEPSADLFNLLLATSIRRSALLELEWKVSLPPRPGERR
jgi:hypothetical protein